MQLTRGRALGPYEIVEQIGAGGMGAVYRGRDTRLNRAVAIKVLASELIANPKQRERLTREARSISSLSHPNICALYDIGQEDGFDYLVMEFLEGESLAQRLEQGPMPLRQALRTGAEIASALDAAHRAGVVHRDLKPANVMLTRTGARLVDFGLAKPAVESEASPEGSTAAMPLTEPGSVVGTLQYMSPEQIGGAVVDARSDIFSFGAMLCEMVTGYRAFDGSTRMSVISALLNDTAAHLDDVPEPLRRVVAKCLEKEPDARWQSAADLRDELLWVASTSSAARPAAEARMRLWPWIATAAALFLAALAAAAFVVLRPKPVIARQFRFGITPPSGSSFTQRATNGELAVSPDGKWIAFAALKGGQRFLYIRPLDALAARELPGTIGAMSPFWSPDSRWIGFFAGTSMKKLALEGGPPQIICPAVGGSATWSSQGTILFDEWGPTSSDQIFRVSENGGKPVEVTKGNGWHYWPSFLPDGKHFLFVLNMGSKPETGLYLASVDGGEQTMLVPRGRRGQGVKGGWIYYGRDDALVKQKLDVSAGRMSGEASVVAEHLFSFLPTGNANFSVDEDGSVIAYQRQPLETQLVWRDENGHETGRAKMTFRCRKFRISPDGRRIAVDQFDAATGVSNVWMYDIARGVATRVTASAFGVFSPIWLRDGRELVVSAVSPNDETHAPALALVTLATGAVRQLINNDGITRPNDVTPDGAQILYTIDRGPGADIELFPMSGRGTNTRVQSSAFNENNGALTRDGRFLAFESDESGQPEVYVTTLAGGLEKTRVSTDGGTEPRWSPDGRSLYYLAADGMLMRVPITTADSITVGTPNALFRITSAAMMDFQELGLSHYDIAPDGAHILSREIPGGIDESPLAVVVTR